jgi:hypothetical protein
MAVVIKRITAPLPRKINPDIPEAVERVILKALAKAPADRYQSAGELAGTLKKAAGVVEKKAVPVVAPTEEAVPFWRRVPLWAWGAVGGVVLLLPPMPTDTPEPTPTCTPPPTPTDTPSPPTPTPFPTPSGGRIAFVSRRDSNGEIYVMNADPSAGSGHSGSGVTRLTNNPADDRHPSWGL